MLPQFVQEFAKKLTKIKKTDQWHIYAAGILISVIALLLIIKLAWVDPKRKAVALAKQKEIELAIAQKEEYYKKESNLRMDNLKIAQKLYKKKHKRYTDDLGKLVEISEKNYRSTAKSAIKSIPLSDGNFVSDSLSFSPKSHQPYAIKLDSTASKPKPVKGKSTKAKEKYTYHYKIIDPDGYGIAEDDTVDDISNQSTKD